MKRLGRRSLPTVKTLKFLTGDGCTSAVNVAQELGYYKEQGLTVEGFKGDSDVEAIGTNQVQIAIGHIAKSMVPATNGVKSLFRWRCAPTYRMQGYVCALMRVITRATMT